MNYDDKVLSELLISINEEAAINEISTTFPVIIEKIETISNTTNKISVLKFSQIPPKKIIQIYIPSKSDKSEIYFINSKELNLKITDDINITHHTQYRIISSFIYAVIYAIVFGTFYYFSQKAYGEFKEKIKKLEDKTEKSKLLNAKFKSLIFSQLAARDKELNFWKDTIRKTFYKFDFDKNKMNVFFDLITETLGTYKIKDKKYIKEHEELRKITEFIDEERTK